MKKQNIVIIIGIIATLCIIGYFVYANSTDKPRYGLSCEEMFDFAMSSEHKDLTMEQHMEFRKSYDPCIQSMNKNNP